MKYRRILPILAATSALAIAYSPSLHAASQTWDPTLIPAAPAGGMGTWNTTNANWSNGASDAVWGNSNTSDAVFTGTGATVMIGGGTGVTANDLTFSKKDYLLASSGAADILTLASADANAPVITVDTGSPDDLASISAKIAGTQGLTKSNTTGNLLLSNTGNTYTGVTSALGRELRFASIANIGAGSSSLGAPTTVADGTIQINNAGSISFIGATGASDRAVNLGSGAGQIRVFAVGNGTGSLSLAGGITGNGQLTLRGNTIAKSSFEESGVIAIGTNQVQVLNSVTATLSNSNNSFTGRLFMNGGKVIVTSLNSASGVNSAAGAGSSLGFTAGGTLVYTGSGDLTTNRTVELVSNSTGDVTIDQSGASGALKFTTNLSNVGSAAQANAKTLVLQGSLGGTGEFAGKLSDAVAGSTTALSVTKSGTGTWTLSGANTYTGNTTVTLGTLRVNGSTHSSSAVSVAANATLGGSGTLAGTTTLNGNLAPGANVGKLTFTGGLTLGALAANALKFELGANTTAGTTYDTIVTNAIDIGTLDFTDFAFTDAGGLAASTYTLISSTADITGSLGTASGAINSSFNGALSISGKDLILTVSSTGSPYTSWAGGAGFEADANGDGVSNGLAWVLGAANPTANALGLVPVSGHHSGNLTLTFKQVNPMAPAKLYVEYSNDLGVLDPWHSVAVPTTNSTVLDVSFTITPGSPTSDVTLTVPASKAAGSKLFGRLRITEN